MTRIIPTPQNIPSAAPHSPAMAFDRSKHSDTALIEHYRALMLPRMIEEKMLLLLRQGQISKWFSGIGQEAIAVGSTRALRDTDYLFPLHRNLGVFTARRMPLPKLFCQWQGKTNGYTRGRDRSFHFGAPEHHIVGMISHLGAMLGVADGVALASVLDGLERVALVYSGDGGTSQGDFHEAVNVAAVWRLPVIFLIENNGYGLSTPSCDQFSCAQLADRAIGYGIDGVTIDGNNILEVHDTISAIAERMRVDRRPVIVEAMTFRMRGHEEASGVAYIPAVTFEPWKAKDPVVTFEEYLRRIGLLNDGIIAFVREQHRHAIDEAVDAMMSAPDPETHAHPITAVGVASSAEPGSAGATGTRVASSSGVATMYTTTELRELDDVFAPSDHEIVEASSNASSERRFVDALSDGLRQAMQRDPRLVIMGQDIAGYGGVFKVTEGFLEEFGSDRVRNTPLCESAIIGAGLGLAICDHPSVIEMQFADFISNGFNQTVNNLAKTYYRWQQPVNVTIRMPTGAGVAAGPFHSQSTEAWFTHVPGLKVVYPSTAFDAKGLIAASVLDPNPVMFYEHKSLYRSVRDIVPDEYYTLAFGQARVVRAGSQASIVTYGLGVHWATALAEAMPDVDLEIIDLRTLIPWDQATVLASARRTGRVLVLYEDTLVGGFGAEIAATIGERCFGSLDAPVMRVASLDTPVPFNKSLEEQFLAKSRLRERVEELVAY